MTNQMMVAIIVDSLIDAGFVEPSDFNEVGKMILAKLERYQKGSDAALSLDKFFSAGDFDTDIFYSHQFVQNEKTAVVSGHEMDVTFKMAHLPLLRGTLTGTIYRRKNRGETDGVAVQTFVEDHDGNFTFTDIGTPDIKVVEAKLDCKTGKLDFIWNQPAGPNFAIVSYEYNMS